MKLRYFLIAFAVGAGLLIAQGPGRGFRQGPGFQRGAAGLGMGANLLDGPNVERRLTRALALNAEQQNKLHTILEEQQVIVKGMPEKVQDLRKQLSAAIRAGNDSQIDQLTRDLSQLNQQRMAISAKSMAKLYQSLDASQKGVLDRAMNREFMPRQQRQLKGRQAPPQPQ